MKKKTVDRLDSLLRFVSNLKPEEQKECLEYINYYWPKHPLTEESIDILNLSKRTYNALKADLNLSSPVKHPRNEPILFIGSLVDLGEIELSQRYELGKKGLAEIKVSLAEHGISL